jgi:hypothetical protein
MLHVFYVSERFQILNSATENFSLRIAGLETCEPSFEIPSCLLERMSSWQSSGGKMRMFSCSPVLNVWMNLSKAIHLLTSSPATDSDKAEVSVLFDTIRMYFSEVE